LNDTLKAAGRIGTELGAAKAENEKLRGLLRDVEFRGLLTGWEPCLIGHITAALSQQDEPTDTYTAVDMVTAAAQGFRDGQAALVEAAQGALSEIQATLEDAYLNAYPECCGQAHLECCGSPLQAWSEADQKIMDRFAPHEKALRHALAAPIAQTAPQGKFRMGDLVKKSTGSEWVGRVVGWYSTEQTKEGYAVESSAHRNSVQIYPAKALEAVE